MATHALVKFNEEYDRFEVVQIQNILYEGKLKFNKTYLTKWRDGKTYECKLIITGTREECQTKLRLIKTLVESTSEEELSKSTKKLHNRRRDLKNVAEHSIVISSRASYSTKQKCISMTQTITSPDQQQEAQQDSSEFKNEIGDLKREKQRLTELINYRDQEIVIYKNMEKEFRMQTIELEDLYNRYDTLRKNKGLFSLVKFSSDTCST